MQNDENKDTTTTTTLEQRIEKRMKLEITLSPDAATQTQRIKLPTLAREAATGGAATDGNTDETQLLSLSLIIGGEKTREILGGAGPYPHQGDPDVFEFIRRPSFSPVLEIAAGKTVTVKFMFTKYPRELMHNERAFR